MSGIHVLNLKDLKRNAWTKPTHLPHLVVIFQGIIKVWFLSLDPFAASFPFRSRWTKFRFACPSPNTHSPTTCARRGRAPAGLHVLLCTFLQFFYFWGVRCSGPPALLKELMPTLTVFCGYWYLGKRPKLFFEEVPNKVTSSTKSLLICILYDILCGSTKTTVSSSRAIVSINISEGNITRVLVIYHCLPCK